MLYSVYRGHLFVVTSFDGKLENGVSRTRIGEARSGEDLWFYNYNPPKFYGAFIQGVDKETEDRILYQQELLPDCPYAWSPLDEDSFFFWDGEKETRLFVAAPDDEEEDLASLGAVKISDEEKNDSGYSLWYYTSDEPDVPEYFSKFDRVWQDLLTDDDFSDPYEDADIDFDESDEYEEDTEWSEEDSGLSDEYPSYDDSAKYDVSNMMDDPFEDAETAQDNYDDLVSDDGDDKPFT